MTSLVESAAQAQYDFYIVKNLKPFEIKFQNSNSYSTQQEHIYWAVNDSIARMIFLNRYSYNKPTIIDIQEVSKDNYKTINYGASVSNSSNSYVDFKLDFFIDYFSKNPTLQQQILKQIFEYPPLRESKDYLLLIDTLIENKVDPLKSIDYFGISDWKLNSIEINTFNDFLNSKNLDENSLNKFWINFFKRRKSQIKTAKDAHIYTEFLMTKYHGEEGKLKPFFESIPLLKSRFEKVELDIIEKEGQYTTSLLINNKKLLKQVTIKGWEFDKYENANRQIGVALGQHFKCLSKVYYENKATKVMRICLIHDDETFNKEKLSTYIKDFYHFLKTSQNFDVVSENIVKWFEQNELRNELNKTETTVQTKIRKI